MRVINTSTDKVVKTVTLEQQLFGMAITPNGNEAYRSNLPEDTVTIIKTSSNAVVNTLGVGDNPDAVSPNNPSGGTFRP